MLWAHLCHLLGSDPGDGCSLLSSPWLCTHPRVSWDEEQTRAVPKPSFLPWSPSLPRWWPAVGLPQTSSAQQEWPWGWRRLDWEGSQVHGGWPRLATLAGKDRSRLGSWWECNNVEGAAPHPSPHPASPVGAPPPGPLSPMGCVKLAHLHCGIHIHEGWIRRTLVNSSSTMIKTYIPIFRGTLMQGLGGRGLATWRGPHKAVPLTFSGHTGP